jgi:DNA replication and repair protein RecF
MISDIRLQHFRSYRDSAFEFSSGVNIIVGPNASGKTNLLEALLVVGRGGSYRASDAELIAFGAPWARLDIHNDDVLHVAKLLREGRDKKLYEVGGKTYKRFVANASIPIVMFEPNHLSLLTGSPEERRNYLDDVLEQTTQGYGQTRRTYRRVLAQRNALLKLGRSKAATQMFAWDVRLSELAGTIVRARAALSMDISDRLPSLYEKLSHSPKNITAQYEALFDSADYETKLLHKLESSLDRDLERGFTGSGPHREDFVVTYDGHVASEAASRGETRTAVLALKIIELQILEAVLDQRPILLLDDVFSELDGSRRKLLTSYIEKYQSFITTTDDDIVVQNFTETCTIIPLNS